MDHGDPFVIKYLDAFYLYHSGETTGRRGISVYRSHDLVDWEFQGYALEPAESGWAWSDLWAPEVVYERGVFYMYVSATRRHDERGPHGRWQLGDGDELGRRLGLARATDPMGPFVLDPEPLVDEWSIDGHPFRDDDGTMWLFYNVHTESLGLDGVLPGTGTVCDRLLAPDRLAGEPVAVTLPSEPWEGVPTGDWYWNEAPYVLKRRGRYYQVYSGGAFADASYAAGVADAPSVRGPWRKHAQNPVVRGGGRIAGPGHHSFVFGPDAATRYAVYHAYVDAEPGRKVLLDRLYWAGDGPHIAGPTADEQPVPPAAVHDPRVPHWRAEAWVRGSWVEVDGGRFALDPPDAWHQVEIVQADARHAVRIGGVLRASRPGAGTPRFETDGEAGFLTISSSLQDDAMHELPAGSEYSWSWGGGGRIELSLAVKGSVDVVLEGTTHRLPGDRDAFRLVTLEHEGDVGTIVVCAGDEGATVTDVCVYARGTA